MSAAGSGVEGLLGQNHKTLLALGKATASPQLFRKPWVSSRRLRLSDIAGRAGNFHLETTGADCSNHPFSWASWVTDVSQGGFFLQEVLTSLAISLPISHRWTCGHTHPFQALKPHSVILKPKNWLLSVYWPLNGF